MVMETFSISGTGPHGGGTEGGSDRRQTDCWLISSMKPFCSDNQLLPSFKNTADVHLQPAAFLTSSQCQSNPAHFPSRKPATRGWTWGSDWELRSWRSSGNHAAFQKYLTFSFKALAVAPDAESEHTADRLFVKCRPTPSCSLSTDLVLIKMTVSMKTRDWSGQKAGNVDFKFLMFSHVLAFNILLNNSWRKWFSDRHTLL